MAQKKKEWTLGELAQALGGVCDGPADLPISGPASAEDGDSRGIAFAESEKFLAKAEASGVGAVLIREGERRTTLPAIRVSNPREAFGVVLAMACRPLPINNGTSPLATIDPEATVDPSAAIGPYVTVERGAQIGAGAKVYSGCYIGENCSVGAGSVLYPNVVLYQDVNLGVGCILHSGVVLGADGFGFVWNGREQQKIPQVGRVEIGDGVELGANTCIDRAMCGVTRIGKGTKIDNLVQVGHNTSIGQHTVIAAGTGISGSCKVGNRNTIAGQVAFSDHVSTCDDVILAGRTALTNDIKRPGAYFGLPARPIQEALKAAALTSKLPDLLSRIRALEAKIKELEKDR